MEQKHLRTANKKIRIAAVLLASILCVTVSATGVSANAAVFSEGILQKEFVGETAPKQSDILQKDAENVVGKEAEDTGFSAQSDPENMLTVESVQDDSLQDAANETVDQQAETPQDTMDGTADQQAEASQDAADGNAKPPVLTAQDAADGATDSTTSEETGQPSDPSALDGDTVPQTEQSEEPQEEPVQSISKAKITGVKAVYAYTGKKIRPAIKVKWQGKILKKGKDYTVSYKGTTAIGTAVITVKGINAFEGKLIKKYKIRPAVPAAPKLSLKNGRNLVVKWSSVKGADGYQIRYVSGGKTKKINVKGGKKVKRTIAKLKLKTGYTVSIRAKKTIGSKTYYSAWSKAKTKKTDPAYLNHVSMTMYVGQKKTIAIKGKVSKPSASSNHKSIAAAAQKYNETTTVTKSGGIRTASVQKKKVKGSYEITAKKAGTATITVRTNGKKYKCKITVKEPPSSIPKALSVTNTAKKTDQILLVYGPYEWTDGVGYYTCSLYEKKDGKWKKTLTTSDCRCGTNGLSYDRTAGDRTTPIGSFQFMYAFGTSNPGTKMPYKQITSKSYFVGDSNSDLYNTWNEGYRVSWGDEHLMDYAQVQYKYGMFFNYNAKRLPHKGSAIFLHCKGTRNTAGCVSVPEDKMKTLMKTLKKGAYIMIVPETKEIVCY